ncbi:MAG: Asp-tRNA(Asn)/Glu-tRNA(Gln) amidotransferase subunit GatC [Clostridia bacterium]|nr:Asp-tRNA(Asn)/Glu-tRNA(Gln) amidotransferase subunit GatC [Clostridia bacterium]
MEKDTLLLLEKVNQLSLTEDERTKLLAFFEGAEQDKAALDTIDTENVARMVHALPIGTVVREDVAKKIFERDELQKGAPEVMDGYWQVPRVVE